MDNNTIIEKKSPDSTPTDFDTLVISGGGVKGICALGALQYAVDNFLLKNVNTFIGTSVGSIIGYLLAIGYTPVEIIVYICTHQLMEKLSHLNIVAMINGGGATSYNNINEQLEKMTVAKIGKLLTLGAIKEKFGKTLIFATHNFTTQQTEYLSAETYPDMPCLVACRMSACLPFVFEKYLYMGSRYIDGGISDNFPIDIGDRIGKKVLGILLGTKFDTPSEPTDDTGIVHDIYRMLFIPINQAVEYKINLASDKCKIIRIDTMQVMSAFNFTMSSHSKLELFSKGYKRAAEQLE